MMTETESRPVKKRRFFVEESPSPGIPLQKDEPLNPAPHSFNCPTPTNEFDEATLAAVVGEELSTEDIGQLRQLSGGNLEKAINVYLDGPWKSAARNKHIVPLVSPLVSRPRNISLTPQETSSSNTSASGVMKKRYIGAFGVTGWSTRSGLGILGYGEAVRIERAKPSGPVPKPGKQPRFTPLKRQDIVVRFTNSKGDEVGRLENESAAWVSSLMDQNICFFDAICVYTPNRIRTNDNIYLQLRCYFCRTAFEVLNAVRIDSNRPLSPFESQESSGERELRLRQVALIRLFDEIKIKPTRSNDQTEKCKRDGLLQAAEKAEIRDLEKSNQSESTPNKTPDEMGPSTPNEELEEGEELQQDQLDAFYRKAQSFDFDTPEANPPKTFALTLRPYQKQALHWMLDKEKNLKSQNQSLHPLWDEYRWPIKDVDDKNLPTVEGQDYFYVNSYSGEMSLEFPVQEQNCLGGILADEMGLGKTIEMLSLIHSHQDKSVAESLNKEVSAFNHLAQFSNSSSQITPSASNITLVVAPMSLIAQWQGEAERASIAGSIKPFVYYGSEKSMDIKALAFEAHKSRIPIVLVTSYGTVLSEFSQASKAVSSFTPTHKGLFSVEYFRVILDEAHSIKNRISKTAKACFEIKARHRWVLTGTPIVNRLEDLFSLVHFLKVEPWSNFSYWKTFITVPFEAKDFIRALDVVQTVLEPLVMRRTKAMKTPSGEFLVPLPTRTINVESIKLSKNEREFYNCIFSRAKQTFKERENAGTLLKSYTTIFAQILRLRQSCCHPILTRKQHIVDEEEDAAAAADLVKGLADDMDLDALLERFTTESDEQDANTFGANVLKQIQDEAETECPICADEPMKNQAVTTCWHSACKQCLLDYAESQVSKGLTAKCFSCREPIDARDVFEVIRHDVVDVSPLKPSTVRRPPLAKVTLRRVDCNGSAKISALLTHLNRIRREDSISKSVVFSQFTSFLDLIEKSLQRDRISYLRFDGSMAQKQRADVINAFVSKPTGVVLLLSLRAGGVGLNLTAANHVYMMDPWWSYAVEAQAIDRVHRMEQERKVMVTRFIVEESIEEKMLRIQERKKFIATSLGMMNNNEELKLQRIEDIKELLS